MKHFLAIVSAMFLTACGGDRPAEPAKTAPKHAPDTYQVAFETSKGVFVVQVIRDWAPRGADRFYELVFMKFYDGARFYRVVPRFVVQFGLKGVPAADRHWSTMYIPDDPVTQNNARGTLSFAMAGAATRTTQVFINLQDNFRLDTMGFAPFGEVVSGMDVVDQLFKGYGDAPPSGAGPEQSRIREEGNEYLERSFPRLDYIKTGTIQ
ncbi:MAG TPA: peptidylprolyl isomerase [Bryobacteraceae bacterium]|nr:peptidylprolyl isomerase [Bryobacteraceae bacterium]